MTEAAASIVNAPIFPLYSQVKYCIRAWDGESVRLVRDMNTAIYEQTGTPQNPVDWSTPDQWIGERLSGDTARLAEKVWKTSEGAVNPRHVYGCYLFINRLDLLDQTGGRFAIHYRARAFLSDNPKLIAELDASEGIPKLLALVSESSPAKRSDLIGDWGAYLQAVSNFTTPKTFNDTLRRRLLNLVERGLLVRDGNRYSITDAGVAYLAQNGQPLERAPEQSERTKVTLAVRNFNVAQTEALKARLMLLAPYEFEHFVKALLEAMDYENVEVTKQSGDKGVDVVANYQFGITEIREVVQVKRTESNIGRRTIDELRGALPYHRAIRGTIITLGGFAKGVAEAALFQGAAPITLIDGNRLLELAIKHQIGVRRKPVDLVELDEAFFVNESSDDEKDQIDKDVT